jgi:hypothetical protein
MVRVGMSEPGAGVRHTRRDGAAAPHARPVNTFQFGMQTIHTKVNIMVPRDSAVEIVDVTAAMHEPTIGHEILDDVFVQTPDGGEA